MQIKRHPRTGLVAAGVLALAVVTAGCGGSSSKATPLAPVGGTATSTSIAAPASTGPAGGSSAPSTGAGTSPTTRAGSTGTKPTAAQLSAVTQQLDLAGSSLSGTDSAISGSDVNQAKAQEGSAP